MDYHKHIKAILPTERWDSGMRESLLVVITDLPLSGSPDHDEEKFVDLQKWVHSYRDKRYPNRKIEYRKD